MKRFAGLTAVVVALQGCIYVTEETARSVSISDLCLAFAIARIGNSSAASGEAALSELVRRSYVSSAEAAAMIRGPAIGMREEAANCAWGGADRINTTTTARGVRRQYVFPGGGYGSTRYLYSENGRITTIQS